MDPFELTISTLGGLEICLRGQPVTAFESRREAALVVYLALNPHVHDRLTLAELLWPGRDPGLARGNLRRALSNLGGALPGVLVSTGQQVSLRSGLGLWVDVYAFESGLAGDRPALEQAIALYHGDFLQGFTIASDEFEDWALLERERLRLRVVDALDRLVDQYEMGGRIPEAIAHANRLLQIDNFREKSHRHMMRLLYRAGERGGALAQYQRVATILAQELGLLPDAETEALAALIRADGHLEAFAAPHAGRLPARSTSFIGRRRELMDIMRLLRDDPDCRLLTLQGAGGVGKTRLALEAAYQLADAFPDGVFWMDLTALEVREALVNSLATALGFVFQPGLPSDEQLINYLRDRTVLLVLDNFEHLIPVACSPLIQLLEAAPGVCALVTSRQPLEIAWEWVYEVYGLAVPPDASAAPLMAYDAIQLFMDRARRVHHDFRLEKNAPEIVRICQLVEGMPLGIELAAGWLRVMACAAIIANLVDLNSGQPGIPDRHRSLRALLDDTWARLSLRDQRLLQMLSVFEGGFTRDAAMTVAGASNAGLAALVNRALLTFDHQSGRHDMHLLTKQYAGQQLAQDTALFARARRQHADYACGLLQGLQAVLDTPAMPAALTAVGADIDNIRAAWRRALAEGWFETTACMLDGLTTFYATHNWNLEAIEMLRAADTLFQAAPETPELVALRQRVVLRLLGPLLATKGYGATEAGEMCNVAWELCKRVEQTPDLIQALYFLGSFYGTRGDFKTALEVTAQGMPMARQYTAETGDEGPLILIYDMYAYCCTFVGRFEEALQHARFMVGHHDAARHTALIRGVGADLGVLGLLRVAFASLFLGFLDQSLWHAQEALALAKTLDDAYSLAFAYALLMLVLAFRGDWEASEMVSQAFVDTCREHNLAYFLASALAHQALGIYYYHKRPEEAIVQLRQGITSWQKTGAENGMPIFLKHLATILWQTGQLEAGQEAVQEGLQHIERTGERMVESGLCRIQGELYRAQGDEAAAERAFERAIAVAQEQHARYFELRATLSLARLWGAQGKGAAAQARLQAIYAWFTEGLDTLYLQEARALLDELPST